MIERTLLWTPQVKQRPRTVVHGGKTMTFTPIKTREAERALAQQWVGSPLDEPIGLDIDLFDDHITLGITKWPLPENKKLTRGDIDNYAKLIMDALNGVAWVDDRQIMYLAVQKM